MVNLLANNYLKAYRMERQMLAVNLIVVGFSIVMFIVSAYIFDNITMLLILTVFAVVLRSALSEIILYKIVNVNIIRCYLSEILLSIVFTLSSTCFDLLKGGIIYTICTVLYVIYIRPKRITFNWLLCVFNKYCQFLFQYYYCKLWIKT